MLFGGSASPRDRYVAATVIQWLGTNVGFSLLSTSLMECGMTIIGSEPHDEDNLIEAIERAIATRDARQLAFDLSEPH